jgi:hypothetical protein
MGAPSALRNVPCQIHDVDCCAQISVVQRKQKAIKRKKTLLTIPFDFAL